MKILEDMGLLEAKTIETPIEQHLKLTNFDDPLLDDPSSYHHLIGHFIYFTITWSDIVYIVHMLSQFMQQPRKSHLDVALYLFHYLKGTPS